MATLALALVVEGTLAHFLVQNEYHNWAARLGNLREAFSVLRWGMAFALLSAVLVSRRIRAQWAGMSGELGEARVSLSFVALHTCAVGIFVGLGLMAELAREAYWPAFCILWPAAGVCAIAFAALAAFPPRIWSRLLHGTGKLWLAAAGVAEVACVLAQRLGTVWDQARLNFAQDMTFWLVRQCLRPFLSAVMMDVPARIIGSERFQIRIAGACSGWEGVVLAFGFSVVWLWLGRRESRFPQALLLIPGAMISIFVLNAVRLAALILIGDHGYPGIAMSGFHSQAGWIGFNSLAVGITLIAPRIEWLRAREDTNPALAGAQGRNLTVAYLLPFAVILAAGAISRAAAEGFEWLYPLRFAAAAGVLWHYRRDYGMSLERPSWFAIISGAFVCAMWIGLDRGAHGASGIGAGLAALPVVARGTWILFRVLAATTTVPLAEELAFRGFLPRRIISDDFQRVPLRRLSWLAVAVSSAAFGLMHGERWLAGTVAGAVYAMAMMRRGKIVDAIAAHATTNGLLAGWVLFGGRWYLW